MKALDARCHGCGGVHIIWVGWNQSEGDVVGYVHEGCIDPPAFHDHTLEASLDGLSDHSKWGPEASA